jgi:hypothetical protein
MYKCLIVFFLGILFNANSQIKQKHLAILRSSITAEINSIRDSLGLQSIQEDTILSKALSLQLKYCFKKNKIIYRYNKPGRRETIERIDFFGGEYFTNTSEKIIRISNYSNKIKKKTIPLFARYLVRSYVRNSDLFLKDSITHFSFNFISTRRGNEYFISAITAKMGHRIPNQLSQNAFGIKGDRNGCRYFGNEHLLRKLATGIELKGREIYFSHHSAEEVFIMLNSSKDGLAIDLLNSRQFNCNTTNIIDGSLVFDGLMLAPVFKTDLIKNNLLKDSKRLLVKLGEVPDSLNLDEISPSLIVIKNNKACQYLIPNDSPNDRYPIIPITPKWESSRKIKLNTRAISATKVDTFKFNTGETYPIMIPTLQVDEEIHSAEIFCYSSIDGNKEHNLKIHQKRGEEIRKIILKQSGKSFPIKIHAKENWDLFYFQLEKLELDHLINLTKDSLRNYVKHDTSINWDSLLFEQRLAIVCINNKSSALDLDKSSALVPNLRLAVFNEDWNSVDEILGRMLMLNIPGYALFEPAIFNKLLDEKTVLTNSSALLSLTNGYLMNKALYVRKWFKEDINSKDQILNLIQLYSVTSDQLIGGWYASDTILEKVLHPNKILGLVDSISSTGVNELYPLNFNIAAIYHYSHLNEYPNVNRSFNYIKDYFMDADLEDTDLLKLCLFYNNWSMWHLTTETLLPRIKESKMSPNFYYLLGTSTLMYNDLDFNDFQFVIEEFRENNPAKFCEYLGEYFQNLRDPMIKRNYCETCN